MLLQNLAKQLQKLWKKMLKNNKIQEEIQKIIENKSLVIVEGKKDKESLNNLGIENVIYLKNKPLFEFVENLDEKDVVILTDLDLEGRKLFSKLRHLLQRRGFNINNNLRNVLFRSNLRCIEGLDTYLKLSEF